MIGQEIYKQLKHLGTQDLWAWGSKNFRVIKSNCFTADIPHRGGLFFQVNGLLHKRKF